MTNVFVYFKYHNAKDGISMGELRVSILNRVGNMIKDLTYEEFKQMKGHNQVRLQKMKQKSFAGV